MLTGLLSQGHSADLTKSQQEQWHPWRAPIGQWGPGFAPTDYVAHYCVIGQCVGIMAAHGMSQMVAFATSHTSPSYPILSHHPSHLPPLSAILTAERDGKKYLQIQPFEIEKNS